MDFTRGSSLRHERSVKERRGGDVLCNVLNLNKLRVADELELELETSKTAT